MALTPLTIPLTQRKADNTAYAEILISGSNIVLATDTSGVLYGTKIVPSASFALNLVSDRDYNLNDLTASNILVKNNLKVDGSIYASIFSASYVYVTSSQIVITDNIVTLNALSPYVRYAGIEMYDSGSGTLSSLLWDSENNYFFVSSSDAGYSRQIILGPELEGSLTSSYLALISGSNNIATSIIKQEGNLITVEGNLSASVFSSSISESVGFYGTASYAISASYTDTASIALYNGLPPGGLNSNILSKKSDNDYDTQWIENPSLIFTSSRFERYPILFPPTSSEITCSSQYGYWHLHTNDDLNVHITSSAEQGSFTIRLVSSGSSLNKITFTPYESITWVGTAGFSSGSIEQVGTIYMLPGQEMLLTFIYYNVTSSLYPEKKFAGIVTDLNMPGLENKTVVASLFVLGEGDPGINGDQLNNPDAFIGTLCGGGIGPDPSGPTNKTFWGWVPVKIEGFGRKYFPLYE